jgi:heme exporter protein CcmD
MTATIFAMENAFEILGSYAITFVVIAGLSWRVLRQSRRLADQIDDDDKYWT